MQHPIRPTPPVSRLPVSRLPVSRPPGPTRRRALAGAVVLVMLATTTAPPAAARCLTAEDARAGIRFTRADGSTGLVMAQGGGLLIDYDTGPTLWDDRRQTRFGIYETETTEYFSHEALVGSGTTTTRWSSARAPARPTPGQVFKTKLTGNWRQEDGTEKGFSTGRWQIDATYRVLPEESAVLSGCSYRILPVEATFTGRGIGQVPGSGKLGSKPGFQRWIYFPDLGIGIETRQDGRRRGLTSLTPR